MIQLRMASFRPLFSIALEHAYFADGQLRDVEFVACAETAKVVASVGMILKPLANGMGLLLDTERLAALRLHAADGSLTFAFKAYVKDRSFASYTAPAVRKDGMVLWFGTKDAADDTLTASGEVSEADFREIDVLVAEGLLAERDRRVPPDFVVAIRLSPAADDILEPRNFRIRFGARQSFWKYNLLGKMNRADACIVDLDNEVEFESCGEVVLPGNRAARVFRSTARIPLAERSSRRFQLRERDPLGDRVLVKRLPVAAESRLGADIIDGRTEVVFENYVNF